jgi:hypothetical protein
MAAKSCAHALQNCPASAIHCSQSISARIHALAAAVRRATFLEQRPAKISMPEFGLAL